MSTAVSELQPSSRRTLKERLAYYLRVVQVIAHAEYKLKYSGSALGYLWSVVKPLGLFLMLYIVFGRFFKLNVGIPHYPVYLLIGIVLWTYFLDATMLTMTSIVERGALVSKLVFPRLIIPISVTVTAGITLLVNLSVIAVFIAANRIVPTVRWLLLIPLLLELYIFTLAVGLILATIFVRLRDLRQVWELVLQLLFYASPILYPASFLPPWWKPVTFVNPFVQVIQQARRVILPASHAEGAAAVYQTAYGELIPLGIVVVLLFIGVRWFRSQAPWFAERI